MKLFAIITAGLMAAGGAAYFIHTGDCPFSGCHDKDSPGAKTGACCSHDSDPQGCCTLPCSACSSDCLSCCEMCELCCTEGVQLPKTNLTASDATEECEHCRTPAKLAIAATSAGASLR